MILVIDSDARLREQIRQELEAAKLVVLEASTEESALEILREHANLVQVALLGLPGSDFLREYSAISPVTKVIVLTSKPSIDDAINLLRGGAQATAVDYLSRNASVKLLKDRLDAILTTLVVNGFRLNTRTGEGFYNDKRCEFTEIERKLLAVFMSNPHKPWTYQELALVVRDEHLDHAQAKYSLKSQMSRLRLKLEECAGRPVITKHQPGRGFSWRERFR